MSAVRRIGKVTRLLLSPRGASYEVRSDLFESSSRQKNLESGSQHKKRCIKDNFRADEPVIQLQILSHETEPQQANGEVSTSSSQDTPGRAGEKNESKEKGTL